MKRFFTQFAFTATLLLIVSVVNAQTIILEENFESTTGSSIPATWSQTTNASDGGWKSGTGSGLTSTYFFIPDHTRILATNDDDCDCDKSNDVLKTPSMDLSGTTNPYISFDLYYMERTESGIKEKLVLKASTDGGANWTFIDTMHYTATPDNQYYAWNTRYFSLSSFAGQSNVIIGWFYNDGGGWLYGAAVDNIKVFDPVPVDVAITSLTPVAGTPESYGIVGENVSFSGTIFNNGTSNLTSATLSYTIDGGSPVNYNLTSINVPQFSSYDFTHTTPYTYTLGEHDVEMTLTVSGDASAGDNTLTTTVVGAAFNPTHVVTIEEATGTWCGWCPRGAVFMDSIYHVYGNNVVPVAVHNGDPMVVSAYDNGVGGLISGYPSALIERKETLDPSDVFIGYDNHIEDFAFATVAAAKSYDNATRILNVDVTVTPAVDLNGNYRLALVLTEDGVTGTGSGYAQQNYYSGYAQLEGAGHNWFTEPAVIPAADMYYDFVARSISGGFTGQANSLPLSMTASTAYDYTFDNISIDTDWEDWNMRAYVLLIDVTNGTILNASSAQIVNGTYDVASEISHLSLYPNPANESLSMLVSLNSKQDVTIELVDVLGKVVATYQYDELTAGINKVNFDISNLASGVYFANVNTQGGMVSRKFVKE